MSVSPTSCCCRHLLRARATRPPTQRFLPQLRHASTSYTTSRQHTAHARQHQRDKQRWQSTDASVSASPPDNPKVASIVDQIGHLTLLETADLVQSLKTRLSIPDMPIGGLAAAAPPPPGSSSTAAAGEAVAEEDDAAPAPAAKTLFTLKLESFDAAAKPKIIKEIKSMLGLSLVESKKFVESAPKVMKEGVPKEEAEKILKTLEGLGGKATMG